MDHAHPAPCIHPADAERFFTEGTQAWPPDPQPSELRHPCCGNFRRDLHKPDCSKAHTNCPGCVGKSAEHLAACPRSVTVDVPGEAKPVPVTELPSVLRGCEYRAGEIPATLKRQLEREELDRLFIKLLYAANRLAEASQDSGHLAIRRHSSAVRDVVREIENAAQGGSLPDATGYSGSAAGAMVDEMRGGPRIVEPRKAVDFGEPFRLEPNRWIVNRDNVELRALIDDGLVLARRMVACLNFCEGTSTETLEHLCFDRGMALTEGRALQPKGGAR